MAKLVCQVHYDPKTKKVQKTWRVLSTGPNDSVTVINSDSEPFVIQTNNARLAKKLGFEKTPNANGKGLFEAPEASAAKAHTIGPVPAWLKLPCGTLDKKGNFVSWGGFGPDGFNDDDGN